MSLDQEYRDQLRAERLEAMRGWWNVYVAQAPQTEEGCVNVCNTALDAFCKKFGMKL